MILEDVKASPTSRGDVKLRVKRRGRDAALRRGSDAPFTELRAEDTNCTNSHELVSNVMTFLKGCAYRIGDN